MDKRLTIEAYNTDDRPQIKAADSEDGVFDIWADGVTVRGLDIYGATGDFTAGINVFASNVTIHDNLVGTSETYRNYWGIYLRGSSGSVISGNTCDYNLEDGIYVSRVTASLITSNSCNNNGNDGMVLRDSHFNRILDNTLGGNSDDGLYMVESDFNLIQGNLATFNGYNGVSLDSSFSGDGSDNNVLVQNEFTNNGGSGEFWEIAGYGVAIDESNNNLIFLNDLSNE